MGWKKKKIWGKITVLYFTVLLEIPARKTLNVFIHTHKKIQCIILSAIYRTIQYIIKYIAISTI